MSGLAVQSVTSSITHLQRDGCRGNRDEMDFLNCELNVMQPPSNRLLSFNVMKSKLWSCDTLSYEQMRFCLIVGYEFFYYLNLLSRAASSR